MTELQRAKQVHSFNVLDHNDDSVLEKQDFVDVADRLATLREYKEGGSKHRFVRQEMLRMWTNAGALSGADGEVQITLDDWLTHEQKVIDASVLVHSYMQGLARALFDTLDADGEESLTRQQFLHVAT